MKWYAKAAAQGHATAQYNLGVSYELGKGVVQDAALAVEWYKKAAAQSFEPAMAIVARLTASKRAS